MSALLNVSLFLHHDCSFELGLLNHSGVETLVAYAHIYWIIQRFSIHRNIKSARLIALVEVFGLGGSTTLLVDGAKNLFALTKGVHLLWHRSGRGSLEFRRWHLNLVAITASLVIARGWAERSIFRLVRNLLNRTWCSCMERSIKWSICIYDRTRITTWSISSMGSVIFWLLFFKQCLNFVSSWALSFFGLRFVKDFQETLWKFITEHTSPGNSAIRTWFHGNLTRISVFIVRFGHYKGATWGSYVFVCCILRNEGLVKRIDLWCSNFDLVVSSRIHRRHGLVENVDWWCIRFALVLLGRYHRCSFTTSLGFSTINCEFTNLRLTHRMLLNEFWGSVLWRNWLDRRRDFSLGCFILYRLNSLRVSRRCNSCMSRNIYYTTLWRTKSCCCRGLHSGHRALRSVSCRLDLSRCLSSDRRRDGSLSRFRRVRSHTRVLRFRLRSCFQHRLLRSRNFGLLAWFHWCLQKGLLLLWC